MRMLSLLALLALLSSGLAGCATSGDDEGEREIELSEVPAAALAAAQAAVDGLQIREAEVEEEDGRTLYCLEGMANGEHYEVEVTATGEVVEIEKGHEEDHDHDEDDHDEDDDDG